MQRQSCDSFPVFFRNWFLLCRSSLLVFWAIQIILWWLTAVVMTVAEGIAGKDAFPVDIPGLLAFCGGAIASFCASVSLNGAYFALAVGYGVPRRRTLAAVWGMGALYGAAMMLATRLLQLLWSVTFAAGRQPIDLIGMIPWWGWTAAVLLPIAVAVFGNGIVRTFGARGGLALYILFMVICIVPSQVMEDLFDSAEQILAALPWMFAVAGGVCGVVGSVLLLRADLKNA